MKAKSFLRGLTGVAMVCALTTVAQSPDASAPVPAAAAAAGPADPAPPVWSAGPIDFSGFIDGYWNFNANHPATKSYGNQLHNFDFDADSFSLSMARLSLAHDPDPVGFRLDLGFGKGYKYFLASDYSDFAHVEQAYVAVKPKGAKGFEADFGEFVTSAGAELTEAKDNYNYSRSFLYEFGPFYHTGLRTTMPITKSFTAGVQVVNGWNNFVDNNSGKTIGITTLLTKPKFSFAGNYYGGPENSGTNTGKRNYFDTVLTLTPTAKFSWYLNYDYWQNRNAAQVAPDRYVATTLDRFQGFATAARLQATARVAFAGRFEYISDASDAGASIGTGTRQKLNEFTLTAEYKMPEGLLARLEYRRDASDRPYFNKGSALAVSKDQSTLELGVIAFFGPKR